MIPAPYALLLLGLAAYRLTRLIGWDTITEPIRVKLTGYSDNGTHAIHWDAAANAGSGTWAHSPRDRKKLAEFIHCPWCQGFWTTIALWAAWYAWPHAVLLGCVPLALSAIVGLVSKNLDA